MIDNDEVRSKLCAETNPINGCCVTPTGVVVHCGSGCNGCIFFTKG